MFKFLFALRKTCYAHRWSSEAHKSHYWSITRMGDTAWFKCLRSDGR